MEKTIESLLVQILESQTEIKSDICDLTNKVDKNTIMLEKMQTDIKTLAEIQSSFADQLDKAKDKDGKSLDERLDVIELAVTTSSKSINEISDKLDIISKDLNFVEVATGKNIADIAHLEAVK